MVHEKLKSDKFKIAVVSHHYNVHDEYIGVPIIRSLEKYGAEVILHQTYTILETD